MHETSHRAGFVCVTHSVGHLVGMGWDGNGMGWDGVGDGMVWHGMVQYEMDGMGWDGMSWTSTHSCMGHCHSALLPLCFKDEDDSG